MKKRKNEDAKKKHHTEALNEGDRKRIALIKRGREGFERLVGGRIKRLGGGKLKIGKKMCGKTGA